MTQAGLHSGASPFPSGLRLLIRAGSIEEMQEKAAFWRVRATQLEPGGYRGSIHVIHTPLMQVGLSVRSNSTKVEGFIPERTLVLALPISVGSSVQNRGRRLAENAIVTYDHTEGLEFSFKGPLKLITVAVSVDEIERRAQNLDCGHIESRGASAKFHPGDSALSNQSSQLSAAYA